MSMFNQARVRTVASCLIIGVGFSAGCNSKNIIVMTPPKAGFSASSFKITHQRSDGAYEEASKDKLLFFEHQLHRYLLAQGKSAKLSQGDEMEIRYAVIQYDEGNRVVRWLVPGVAGEAKLKIGVDVVSKDGEVAGHFITGVEMTGFMSGLGGCTDEAFDDAASKMAQYIGQNFSK